jgi:hypothetical protein
MVFTVYLQISDGKSSQMYEVVTDVLICTDLQMRNEPKEPDGPKEPEDAVLVLGS